MLTWNQQRVEFVHDGSGPMTTRVGQDEVWQGVQPFWTADQILHGCFSLPCTSCGTPVELPGRYGYKLKNDGITITVCRTWRQGPFLASRRDNISNQIALGARPDQRRLIPFTAADAALAL